MRISNWYNESVEEYKEIRNNAISAESFHVAKYFRQTEFTCAWCGQQGHLHRDFPNAVQCLHCKGSHYAFDKKFRKYVIEAEIVNTQIKEKPLELQLVLK